jgi:hypothetical protein
LRTSWGVRNQSIVFDSSSVEFDRCCGGDAAQ